MHNIPGKIDLTTDAASPYPIFINELNSHDANFRDKSLLVASLIHDVCHLMAIKSKEIFKEKCDGKLLSSLIRCIKEGKSKKNDKSLSTYFRLYLIYICS